MGNPGFGLPGSKQEARASASRSRVVQACESDGRPCSWSAPRGRTGMGVAEAEAEGGKWSWQRQSAGDGCAERRPDCQRELGDDQGQRGSGRDGWRCLFFFWDCPPHGMESELSLGITGWARVGRGLRLTPTVKCTVGIAPGCFGPSADDPHVCPKQPNSLTPALPLRPFPAFRWSLACATTRRPATSRVPESSVLYSVHFVECRTDNTAQHRQHTCTCHAPHRIERAVMHRGPSLPGCLVATASKPN